jgi:hypothetical protein
VSRRFDAGPLFSLLLRQINSERRSFLAEIRRFLSGLTRCSSLFLLAVAAVLFLKTADYHYDLPDESDLSCILFYTTSLEVSTKLN